MFRLDYLSCVLTVASTILIGKKRWEGWIVAGINSLVICVIGLHTAQTGFIPANLFCLVLYAWNLRGWIKRPAISVARETGPLEVPRASDTCAADLDMRSVEASIGG